MELKNFEKYLRAEREEVDWCFAGFGKTFKFFLYKRFFAQSEKKYVEERMFSCI